MAAARVAIVGAGMAGATLAHALAADGLEVAVFEKARGAGGRMSTRRRAPWAFDHGAQYLTARAAPFRAAAEAWVAAGVLAPWNARLVDIDARGLRPHPSSHPRYVGVPGMNAVCKHLLGTLPLHRATRVARIDREGEGWHLTHEDGTAGGGYDAVVVTAPPAQSGALLAAAPALAAETARATVAPCWTWMAAFDAPTGLAFDGAFVADAPLGWVARNTSKPGRADPGEAWIAQATAAWTDARIDESPESVAAALEAAFREVTGYRGDAPAQTFVHRWLYAHPSAPLERPYLWDADLRIGACGDWLLGRRVEAAWTSAQALAPVVAAACAA